MCAGPQERQENILRLILWRQDLTLRLYSLARLAANALQQSCLWHWVYGYIQDHAWFVVQQVLLKSNWMVTKIVSLAPPLK